MNSFEGENNVIARDYVSEIVELLNKKLTPAALADRLFDYHENDIADSLELLDKPKRKLIYSVLDDDALANVFEYSENINDYIDELAIKRKIILLSRLETTVAVEYLDALEEDERNRIISQMDSETQDELSLLASFDEDEIGCRISTNYIAIRRGSSIKEAMSALVTEAAEIDNISTLYIIDEREHLYGAVDLKDLIRARKEDSLEDITMTSYPYVYGTEKIDDTIERLKDYSEDSIPVIDAEGVLIGVLISSDITELVDEEMGEDYAMLAGLSAEEDSEEPVFRSITKRLPWLVILLGLGLLVSGVVGAFEHVVAHLTLIVCFQSLILGMAGNAGTQSLAVTIRILMDENLTAKQKCIHVLKEAQIGLINGVILAVLSFGFIGLYIAWFKGYSYGYAFSVSICTSIALLLSILVSAVVGTVVPIVFKKIKIDPAVASGPLITTINDLVAVVSYYGIAWLLLINVLGL